MGLKQRNSLLLVKLLRERKELSPALCPLPAEWLEEEGGAGFTAPPIPSPCLGFKCLEGSNWTSVQ